MHTIGIERTNEL